MSPFNKNQHIADLDEHLVIHPLDDEHQEQKKDPSKLGPMKLTRSVCFSLFTLRGYLVIMTLLLVYHILDLGGVFRK